MDPNLLTSQNYKVSTKDINNDMVTEDPKENSTNDLDEVQEEHSVSFKNELDVKEVPEENMDSNLLAPENYTGSTSANDVEVVNNTVKKDLDNDIDVTKEGLDASVKVEAKNDKGESGVFSILAFVMIFMGLSIYLG